MSEQEIIADLMSKVDGWRLLAERYREALEEVRATLKVVRAHVSPALQTSIYKQVDASLAGIDEALNPTQPAEGRET